MSDLIIDAQTVVLQPGVRARPGAVKQADGQYAEADLEVFVSVSVGVVRAGPQLLDKTGKATGVLVQLGGLSRPLADVRADARKQLGLIEQQAEDSQLLRSV